MPDTEDGERCSYCGDGDPVPTRGYWICPECDAEWNVEDEDDEQRPARDLLSTLQEIKGVGRG